jgi:predicted MFS family arabinose efflux permease
VRVWPGFTRFTVAHALAAVGDALVTVSLAGSLFFNVSPDASRRQVLTYLIITMVPFAVLAPLIGPAIDRFRRGHRWIAVSLYLVRAVTAVILATALFDLAFYLVALVLLVASRASGVLRQALVPGLVPDHRDLVSANSSLARIATVAGGIGGAIGAFLAATAGTTAPLVAATAAFLAAALVALRLPRPRDAGGFHEPDDPDGEQEYIELHRPLIAVSAAGYTLIRAAGGAFVFGLAFALRRANEPAWVYGLALLAYGVGAFVGNVAAPVLRRRIRDDWLIAASLGGLAVATAFGALGSGRPLVISVAVAMGVATTLGRQGFDSLVQGLAPHALHGRTFARFETQFQLGWVLGAAFATAAAVSTQISLIVVTAVVVPATVLYVAGMRDARAHDRLAADDPRHIAATMIGQAQTLLANDRTTAAAVHATGAVDLFASTGALVAPPLRAAAAALRSTALAGDHVDRDRCVRFIDQARLAIAVDPLQPPADDADERDITDAVPSPTSTTTTSSERSDSST